MNRRDRVARLLADDGIDVAAMDSRLRGPCDETRCPTSLAQRRLWFLDQRYPGTAAYHIPIGLRMVGGLDVPALTQALTAIAGRHEALRTTIEADGGVPLQVIQAPRPVHLPLVPADGLEAESAYRAAAAPLIAAPFELGRHPGWRAALLRRSGHDHCLLLVFHHAIYDGASGVVLGGDIELAYRNACAGVTPLLPPARIQFGDIAAWQSVREALGLLEPHADYWVSRLASPPPPMDLGGDRAGTCPSQAGGRVHRGMDRALADGLAAIARAERATPFVAGLAAWAAWLRQRSGATDVVVATPSAGRVRPSFEDAIGMLTNTLPLRVDMGGAPTYRDIVRRARASLTEAHPHEEAPLDRVIERLRAAGRSAPLAQTAFSLIQQPATLPVLPGLQCSTVTMTVPAARTELAVSLAQRDGQWTASLEHGAAHFSPEAAARALDEFLETAAGLVAAPDARLAARPERRPAPDAAAAPGVPLSPIQLRVWLDQQRSPGAPLHNVAVTMSMHGPLDADAFERAFARLVAAHDVLRLSVSSHGGVPVQRVTEDPAVLERVDLGPVTDAEVDAWCEARTARPFVLAGPLYRSILATCGPGHFCWLFVQHHLITDGTSIRLLLERMATFYDEETSGTRSTPALPGFLETIRLHEDVAADGGDVVTTAPPAAPRLFGPRPPGASTRVTRTRVPMDGGRAARLAEAARRMDAAGSVDHGRFVLMAAALVGWLHARTGERQITIGFPHHRRGPRERQVAGLFMDVLPLTVTCDAADTVAGLAAHIRRSIRQALRSVARGRATSPQPAAEVLLNVQTAPMPVLPGLDASSDWVHPGADRESLSIQLYGRHHGDLTLAIDTHDEVFDAGRRARVIGEFARVLDQVMAAPDTRLGALRLLDDAGRAAALAAGTGPRCEGAASGPVAAEIWRQAQATPHAPAIQHGDRVVTYAELVAEAGRVASGLDARGIGQGHLVGVRLPRSPEHVIAILGVLAAGAAYLPLDPAAPAARTSRLARESRVALVIGETAGADVVAMSGLLATPFLPDAPRQVAGDDLAYVIHTSGSTGVPRAVEIPHRALANYTAYARQAFGLTPDDRALQFASLTFDTAVEEIFPTLAAGATLVLRDDRMAGSARDFMAHLAEARISVLNLPTAYWHLLADAGVPLPTSVRLVLVGGERMRAASLARWRRSVSPTVRILNGYGPTEATVVATFAEVGDAADGPVSIGRPIWNVEAHVLDDTREPVAPEVPGELYIGGLGLALGYRGDAGATAERFVAHPFGAPGSRLYRTGDRARRRPDGALEFLGRLDDQVKVRGFRVDPGEVEQALAAHPGVADAAVIAVARAEGYDLSACVVPAGAAALEEADLRSFLDGRLPSYMVPSAFRQYPALPRTPHGKIDRAALEACTGAPLARASGPAAARSDAERRLLALWQAVLERDDLGVHDSFFDVGGHSLRAAQLAARAGDAFGVDVPLPVIFEHPTIAAQAACIEGLAPVERVAPLARSAPRTEGEPAPPMSFVQERMWLAEQLTPGTSQYTIGARLSLRGDLDVDALQRAFDVLVTRHAVLRTTLEPGAGGGSQVVHPPRPIAIEQADASQADDPHLMAARLARELVERPFVLSEFPLVRARLIRVKAREHHLAVTFHHAIFDAWSGPVFAQELGKLYDAAVSGTTPDLPPAPPDYATFAAWQRGQLTGSRLDALVDYWRTRLCGAPALALPGDGPPSGSDVRGDAAERRLTKDETDALGRLAASCGATPFMVTAAAFALVLGRLADQQDVVFGAPVAGRGRVEFERTIGCFLNTLVMRCDVSGNPTVRELVGRARETALGAFAHQDLPFERLVEALQPARAPGRQPFFDAMLNFVNTPTVSPLVGDLQLALLPADQHDAKMALTIYASIASGRLGLRAVWRASRFSRARGAAMLDQLVVVLQQMAADADAHVDDISLVTPHASQVLPDGRRPLVATSHVPVLTSFADCVAAHPDRIAVEGRGARITYLDLSSAAATVAGKVAAAGLPPGTRVGVLGAPSGQFLAALLGVWAEGHVTVPLDPALPAERLLVMCQLADVQLLVATERVPVAWRGRTAVIEAHREALETGGGPLAPRPAGDAAYVCFTSGSAGMPKGVLGSHRGLAHFLDWQRTAFGVTAGERIGQVTSPSFDVFLREALLPITSGGTLVIPGTAEGPTSGSTLSWLGRTGVTLLHAVPTMAESWLEAEPEALVPDLRLVFFAGEPLTRDLVARWQAVAPRCRVVNLYGPTETTLAKCAHEVDGRAGHALVPIGRPMPGAEALVLRGARSCGIGEPGEIVIRTPYMSLGYLQPDNPSRFVPNPVAGSAGDTVYRTGDRGRFAPDGSLEIDGRFDDAVKIRGVRVDAAEVAAVLSARPDIRAAAVLVNRGDDITLVAFVAGQREVPAAELRRHIVASLPPAAVPARFVHLRTLPRNANGKVDRAALRALDTRPAAPRPLVPPRPGTESALAALWAEVLDVPRVGRDDDFFESGGHSLLAAQLAARVALAFGVEVPLRLIFDAPTLADLAGAIDGANLAPQAPVPIPRVDRAMLRGELT